ncbi:unnamed protein product [Effrenium voratum]|uniref:Uncharacterized protein n=1 Tax=Effrenium voratum TaxID=2562239 RepID=A0AA36IXK6_9DINO|nr:unnamed protein product [Effrenium voratum]
MDAMAQPLKRSPPSKLNVARVAKVAAAAAAAAARTSGQRETPRRDPLSRVCRTAGAGRPPPGVTRHEPLCAPEQCGSQVVPAAPDKSDPLPERPASCFSIADENTPLALGQLESIVEEGSPSSCADLQSENEALRVALSECLQRLEVLEAEREDFISEGVFDLVNSLWLGEAGQAKRERQGYTVETADRTK